MKNGKLNTWRKGLSALSLLVAMLCVCVTPTMARYLTTGSAVASFAIDVAPKQIYLLNSRNDQGVGTDFTVDVDNVMQFLCVSNADKTGTAIAQEDVTFRVRLYIKEDIAPNEMLITTHYGEVYGEYGPDVAATARRLDDDSALAKKEGKGWIYMFCDANGNELLFTLPGGEVSDLYFVFTKTAEKTGPIYFDDFQFKIEIVESE